jgi:hypothetical protein
MLARIMNFIAFPAASALGLLVWFQTGSPLLALVVWAFAAVVLGIATGLVKGDVALDWDSCDASDCGGGDGGGGGD